MTGNESNPKINSGDPNGKSQKGRKLTTHLWCYSDYCIINLVKCLVSFKLVDVIAEMGLKPERIPHIGGDFYVTVDNQAILEYLLTKGYVKTITHTELSLGEYGAIEVSLSEYKEACRVKGIKNEDNS